MRLLAILAAVAALCLPAHASDLAGIEAGTGMLYSNGRPVCSAQIVHSKPGKGDAGTETIVLTANHCVHSKDDEFAFAVPTYTEDADMLKVTLYGATVLKQEAKSDIAVFKLRDTETTLAAVDVATPEEAKAALIKGTRILAIGFPGTSYLPMKDLIVTDGLYVGKTDALSPGANAKFYRTTISVFYGNSGGGLYVQVGEEWKLVGVTSELDPERMWNTSLFSPVDTKSSFLRGAWNPDLSDPAYREK